MPEMGDPRSLDSIPKDGAPSHDDEPIHEKLWLFVASIGFLCAGAGVLAFLYQCALWLKYGAWREIPFYEGWLGLGLPMPETPGLAGLQKIIVWIFEGALSGNLIVAGIALMFFAIWRGNR